MGRVYLPRATISARFGVGPALERQAARDRPHERSICFETGRHRRVVRAGHGPAAPAGQAQPGVHGRHGGHLPSAARQDRGRPDSVLDGRISLSAGEKLTVAALAMATGAGMTSGLACQKSGPAPPRCHIVVVGGGLAGISAALGCTDGGAQVTLFEKRARLGGLTWSFSHDGLQHGQRPARVPALLHRLSRLPDRIGSSADVELQARLDVTVLGRVTGARRLVRAPRPAPPPCAGTDSVHRFTWRGPYWGTVTSRLGSGRASGSPRSRWPTWTSTTRRSTTRRFAAWLARRRARASCH